MRLLFITILSTLSIIRSYAQWQNLDKKQFVYSYKYSTPNDVKIKSHFGGKYTFNIDSVIKLKGENCYLVVLSKFFDPHGYFKYYEKTKDGVLSIKKIYIKDKGESYITDYSSFFYINGDLITTWALKKNAIKRIFNNGLNIHQLVDSLNKSDSQNNFFSIRHVLIFPQALKIRNRKPNSEELGMRSIDVWASLTKKNVTIKNTIGHSADLYTEGCNKCGLIFYYSSKVGILHSLNEEIMADKETTYSFNLEEMK